MECPHCSSISLKVTNKRSSPNGIRRRRECLKCKKRFTTYEKIFNDEIYVIKKDGSKEKFDIEKIKKGIQKAFEKRPVEEEQIDKMVEIIERVLKRKPSKCINTSYIGDLVMKKIKKVDNVAYIRFASVYRNFQDVKDFKKEIKVLNS